jgi:hypothetical protein
MKKQIRFEVFAVCNSDGKFLRSKGFGGSGEKWVDQISSARIYPRIGPARAQVTWFAKNHPEYGVPKVVKLVVTEIELLDETSRVEQVIGAEDKRAYEAKRKRLESEKKRIEKQLKELDT